MFNIGDKFEIKISGVFVIEGGIFYAAEGIKDYLFDEDELKQLISCTVDECRKTGRRSEKNYKAFGGDAK